MQLRDGDIPDIPADPLPTSAPARAGRGKRKAEPVEPVDPEYAHRSLYARPETLDLIRELAFKKRISAQSMYRRGLLLMLQAEGHYLDKGEDDV